MNSGEMGRNSSHTAKKYSGDQISLTGFSKPRLSASTSLPWLFPGWTLGGVSTAMGDQGPPGKVTLFPLWRRVGGDYRSLVKGEDPPPPTSAAVRSQCWETAWEPRVLLRSRPIRSLEFQLRFLNSGRYHL